MENEWKRLTVLKKVGATCDERSWVCGACGALLYASESKCYLCASIRRVYKSYPCARKWSEWCAAEVENLKSKHVKAEVQVTGKMMAVYVGRGRYEPEGELGERMYGTTKFCPNCDCPIPGKQWESFYGLDITVCPSCKKAALSMFYSYGSRTHRRRYEEWADGEISGRPVPPPEVKDE